MVFNPKIKKDVNLNYVMWTRVSQFGIWTVEPSLVLVVCVSTSTVLMLPDMNSSLGLNMYFTFLDSTRVKLVKNNPNKPCQCSVPLQHPLLLPSDHISYQRTQPISLLLMQPLCWTCDRKMCMFVLQLRSNKRKISVHVGQRWGAGSG